MARRLPDDPSKRRLQVFKRIYQHLEHIWALAEDRGMDRVLTDPETGEDIYVGDLLVGLDSLPPRQREAFELICLRGYTETAARDEMLPNSKSSTPVQQYADSGLARVVSAYDAFQRGEWPPLEQLKPIKKPKRRSLVMAALHPIVRQSLEAARKKVLAEIEALKVALDQLNEMLGDKSDKPEISPTLVVSPDPVVAAPTTPAPVVAKAPEGKPDLGAMAKQMTAAAIAE